MQACKTHCFSALSFGLRDSDKRPYTFGTHLHGILQSPLLFQFPQGFLKIHRGMYR